LIPFLKLSQNNSFLFIINCYYFSVRIKRTNINIPISLLRGQNMNHGGGVLKITSPSCSILHPTILFFAQYLYLFLSFFEYWCLTQEWLLIPRQIFCTWFLPLVLWSLVYFARRFSKFLPRPACDYSPTTAPIRVTEMASYLKGFFVLFFLFCVEIFFWFGLVFLR
jgi:hypothetical protein